MFKKILLVVALLFMAGFVLADDSNYLVIQREEYDLTVKSPIEMRLSSDFKISPDAIKVRGKDNIAIVSGQSFVYRYNFVNNLDYDVLGRYQLEFGVADSSQLRNLGVYVSKALTDNECASEVGKLLEYAGQRIVVSENGNGIEKNLCADTKDMSYSIDYVGQGMLVLDMLLRPGDNYFYFLFVTSPAFSLIDSSFPFKDTLMLKADIDTEADFGSFEQGLQNTAESFGSVTAKSAESPEQSRELRYYNSQENYTKINPNYNTNPTNITTLEVTENKEHTGTTAKLSEDASIVKSKATALVTMNPSKLGVIVFGVLCVVALALFVYSRKDKDLSDAR